MKILHSITALICLVTITANLDACLITFTNDKSSSILVVEYNDNSNALAPSPCLYFSKNYSRRIGKPHELANFIVFTKKGQSFFPRYHVKQTRCGEKPNPKLNLSDIQNSSGIVQGIFEISTIENPSSMAQDAAANIQIGRHQEDNDTLLKSSCSACQKAK